MQNLMSLKEIFFLRVEKIMSSFEGLKKILNGFKEKKMRKRRNQQHFEYVQKEKTKTGY